MAWDRSTHYFEVTRTSTGRKCETELRTSKAFNRVRVMWWNDHQVRTSKIKGRGYLDDHGTLGKLSFHEQTSGNTGARRSLGGSVAYSMRSGIAQLIEHGSGRAYLLLLVFPVVFCIPPTKSNFQNEASFSSKHYSQVLAPLPAQACATTCQGCTYSIPGYYCSNAALLTFD